MIIVYHKNNKIVEADFEGENLLFSAKSIASNLFQIAEKYPQELIVWCLLDVKSNLNKEKIQEIFHHKKITASYNLSINPFLPETIGYVDESPSLNVKKNVSYPTWRLSADIGGIYAEVLNTLKNQIREDVNFDYFLHSMAKLASLTGLLCYSEPLLVKDFSKKKENKNNNKYFKNKLTQKKF